MALTIKNLKQQSFLLNFCQTKVKSQILMIDNIVFNMKSTNLYLPLEHATGT